MYPEYAEIDGKEYKIDTNYDVALKCFEVIDDEEIDNYERVIAIIYLLFDFIPEDNDLLIKLFDKAKLYLQCGKTDEQQTKNKKDMDFIQDRGLINASFMYDYKIDLSKTKIHFWQFIELIEGLSENCSLNRVREIRNYDLSEEKDAKRRKKIEDAKKALALKENTFHTKKDYTDDEIKSMENFYKLMNGKE